MRIFNIISTTDPVVLIRLLHTSILHQISPYKL